MKLADPLGGLKLSLSIRWSSDPLVKLASIPFNTVQDCSYLGGRRVVGSVGFRVGRKRV